MAGKSKLILPLNWQAVKAAKPINGRATEYQIGTERGLKLLVFPSGVGTFLLRYDAFLGSKRIQRKLRLGRRDDITLQDAREKADELRREVNAGKDPVAEAVADDEERSNALTFSKLVEDRIAKDKDLADGTKRLYREALGKDVLPVIGALPIDRVTTAHILAILDKIEARGSLVQCDRTRCAISGIYAWGRKRGIVAVNPAAGLGRRAPSAPRTRVLTDSELGRLWKATAAPDAWVSQSMQTIIRLAMLTGQRRSEVAGARVAELALDSNAPMWTIPGDTRRTGKVIRGRTKNRRTQVLPLSTQAVALFKQAITRAGKSELVFPPGRIPGEETKETRVPHVNGESVSRALRRIRDQFGIEDVTIHDMRRCIATWLGESGTRPDVIDRILNHVPRDVTRRHYNFAGMDSLVREAMQKWADHVTTISVDKPARSSNEASREVVLGGDEQSLA